VSGSPRATADHGGARPRGDLGVHDQAFFLHIPKTAGRSFQHVLRQDAGLGRVLRIPPDEGMFPALLQLDDYRIAHGHAPFPIAGAFRRPPFVMTFIRSPVARVVSAFEYVQRLEGTRENAKRRERGINSLGDLVKSNRASNIQTRLLGVDYEIAPLLERFERGELTAREAREEVRELNRGKRGPGMLKRAKDRLEGIGFLGLTEAFDDSMMLFAATLGLDQRLPSYRRNAAPSLQREARKALYTEADLAAVEADNHLDQRLYEFAVEVFSRRFEETFGRPPSISER
jgi:hypothetical protein